jgi:signal transduction histidine kinase
MTQSTWHQLDIENRALRAANERLRELDRLKDDFVSTVSHELRTPLTSIRAFVEILLQQPALELEQREKFLSIINTESERLTRLINQVLDVSRLESGKARWQAASVDMKEIVSDTITAMDQVFRERRIQAQVKAPDKVSVVSIDVDRIIQVMLTLLSDAAKFCDRDNGRIEVVLSEQAGTLRIDVRDNGPGIDAEDQVAIFDKFSPVRDTLTDRPPGSRLGLYISRKIIEHFGGRLWVESSPGGGACFSFTLPTATPR